MSNVENRPAINPIPADGITYFLHPHPRSPFSEAVQVGNVLFLSAMIGLDEKGELAKGFENEVKFIMSNTADILKKYGLGLEHIFKCTVMLTDIDKWGDFNRLYKPYFHPARLPVRTAFGVTSLAYGATVEIEFWAHVPGEA
ncbi:MAG: RidA family protein [Asticcacaulis sp.]|uniref:RidA family protein n=1 Tax=Asticcacaulis sp. TaxID=1872648 RepID=UPI003F7CD0C0